MFITEHIREPKTVSPPMEGSRFYIMLLSESECIIKSLEDRIFSISCFFY